MQQQYTQDLFKSWIIFFSPRKRRKNLESQQISTKLFIYSVRLLFDQRPKSSILCGISYFVDNVLFVQLTEMESLMFILSILSVGVILSHTEIVTDNSENKEKKTKKTKKRKTPRNRNENRKEKKVEYSHLLFSSFFSLSLL